MLIRGNMQVNKEIYNIASRGWVLRWIKQGRETESSQDKTTCYFKGQGEIWKLWEGATSKYLGRDCSRQRDSKCKGPEVGMCLVHTKNNNEASGTGPEWEGRESEEMRTEIYQGRVSISGRALQASFLGFNSRWNGKAIGGISAEEWHDLIQAFGRSLQLLCK